MHDVGGGVRMARDTAPALAPACPECLGVGVVGVCTPLKPLPRFRACPACGGAGTVCPPLSDPALEVRAYAAAFARE